MNKKRSRTVSVDIQDENSSSSSEKYIISSKENSFKICKIKDRKALSDILKKLKDPFTVLDKKIISEFNIKSKNLKEGESFDKIIDFSQINADKILFLKDEDKIDNFYKNKGNKNKIIFSCFTNKDEKNKVDEIDFESDLFNKLLKFINKIENECNISDFCPEYIYLFENNSIEKYYKSVRKPRSYPFRYHLYYEKNENLKKVLMKLFGPRKTSKSIYLRNVLANYHIRYNIFRPTLIFDLSFISKNIGTNDEIFKKVFYHELFSLFLDIYDVDAFYKLIDFSICETMKFIENIIQLYLKYMNDNKTEIIKYKPHSKPLFCLDNYSSFYDINNDLEKIEYSFKIKGEYNLYIIYNIIEQEDQIQYVNYIQSNIDFNPKLGKNTINYCYASSFRNLYEFKNDLINDNIKIPENYSEIFGQNVYILFKYLNSNIEFSKFVEKEENEIKDELVYFFNKSENKKVILKNIVEIIDKKNEIEFNKDILIHIPSNYIIIHRKKDINSGNYKYFFEYCFPLIEKILKNMIKNTFFIDINNPLFLKLSDAAMGVNFDEFINFFFQNEDSFFGYMKDEIEKSFDEYCLDKDSYEDGEQAFLFSDVIDVLKENKSEILKKLINDYKNRELIKNKKLIIVFQKFEGKFVDILFIVKKENANLYSIVNLQVKLSDSYKISKKDKKLQRYQMSYLREKYQYIFGIKIIDSYVIYLSLFEFKKKFAENNKDIFIYYSKDVNKLVDNNKNALKNFPFLPKAKVELISDYEAFIYSSKKILEIYMGIKFEYVEIEKKTNEDIMEINISEKKIKVEIIYKDKSFLYEETNKNKFKEKIIYYKIMRRKNEIEE